MIKISEDFRYFTHLYGKESVIPFCKGKVTAYPTRLEISHEKKLSVLNMLDQGVSKKFTHMLNIEKGRVEIFGENDSGYFHFLVFAQEGKIFIQYHRGNGIKIDLEGATYDLKPKETVEIFQCQTIAKSVLEKVSFGCSKQPMLEKKIDTNSKLYLLSQMMPQEGEIEISDEAIGCLLIDLFSPQEKDIFYSGIKMPKEGFDPFALFSTYQCRFRRHLILEEENTIYLLPKIKLLPVSGRINGLQAKGCVFDIMWRKNKVVKVIVYPTESISKKIIFPGNFSTYRRKSSALQRGALWDRFKPVELEPGKKIIIDRIQ